MAVYNFSNRDCYQIGIIDINTSPNPQSMYGKSKLEAENELLIIQKKSTPIAIIRTPSIIGRNTEKYLDNYYWAWRIPFFPIMFEQCKRSFIYVDTLSEFIRIVIEKKSSGIFYPQNLPLLSTSEIVQQIEDCNHKKLFKIRIPRIFQFSNKKVSSLYGNIYYTEKLSSHFDNSYNIISSKDAIKLTLED